MDALTSFGAANTETLAELLVAFFAYWAWEHDYGADVVSIRTSRRVTKREKVRLVSRFQSFRGGLLGCNPCAAAGADCSDLQSKGCCQQAQLHSCRLWSLFDRT